MTSNSIENIHKSNSRKSKRYTLAVFIVTIIVSNMIFSSKTVNAGLVSLFEVFVGKQEVAAKSNLVNRSINSQTSSAVVLQSVGGSYGAVANNDIPPIDGESVLSPEIARMNATSTEPLNTQISIYVVRSGDTISGVAKMYNVSVNTVLWANDLNSHSTLQPGQTLIILPVTGITYTIKAKDTIQSIAKKYNADVEDILNYNDLALSAPLKIGDEIIIPNAETSRTTAVSTVGVAVRPDSDSYSWPNYSGYFSCPVPGSRVSQKLHGHNGVDLAAPRGTPIRAAASGTVIINRSNGAWNGGYGNFVVILHPNGTQTLYSHLSKSVVSAGEQIGAMKTIGYVGMTGLTTGPHLHFEVRGAQNIFSDQSLCK